MEGITFATAMTWLTDVGVLAALALGIWAFYTGKIVPVRFVNKISTVSESLEILAHAYAKMADIFDRLTVLLEYEASQKAMAADKDRVKDAKS